MAAFEVSTEGDNESSYDFGLRHQRRNSVDVSAPRLPRCNAVTP